MQHRYVSRGEASAFRLKTSSNLYSRETCTKQNHVDQNFTMMQQFSSVPSAWIHGWVYFSSLLSAGCANKSAHIILAAVLPSYASVRSNPDRADSVTALIITITIITSVELPNWRFGWGVAVIRRSQEVWLEELWISDHKNVYWWNCKKRTFC